MKLCTTILRSISIPSHYLLLSVILSTVALYSQTAVSQEKDNDEWHPEAICIIWPDMRLDFKLPYEEDRSGVANLLFRDRVSGEICLLDSVKKSPIYQSNISAYKSIAHIREARYFTRFEPGSYDAILLYNNGKYIKYDNITFDKDIYTIIDMKEEPVRLADAESQDWLSLRKFQTVIGERTLSKNSTAVSDKKISGYVLFENNRASSYRPNINYLNNNKKIKAVSCAYDGYFEIDIDDNYVEPFLEIYSIGDHPEKIMDIKANSGYFIVLKRVVLSEEELTNIKTGPIRKKKNIDERIK